MRRRDWLLAGVAGLAGCGGNGIAIPLDAALLRCSGSPRLQTRLRSALPASAFPPGYRPSVAEPPLAASSRLDAQFDRALASFRGGVHDAALLRPGIGQWQRRGRVGGGPVDAGTEFWWASCGKALTATLVLQAQQSGLLRLSDPLSRWRPELPRADQTPLLQLMTHTTALLSYNDPSLGGSPLDGYRSPEQLLEQVTPRSRLGCPGLRFAYSNTNYLLLALVLEAVWGQPFHELLRQRIAEPLGLRSLRALRPREEPSRLAPMVDAQQRPVVMNGLSSLLGAGHVLGSAADWVRAWEALLDGRLAGAPEPRFSPLLDMALPDSSAWYGQGVMVLDWRDRQGRDRTWLAHSGGARDAGNAQLLWDPLLRCYAAVVSSSQDAAAAMANALLTELEAAE